eukprot:1152155-Pelagomonas_calceolata.AAC.3
MKWQASGSRQRTRTYGRHLGGVLGSLFKTVKWYHPTRPTREQPQAFGQPQGCDRFEALEMAATSSWTLMLAANAAQQGSSHMLMSTSEFPRCSKEWAVPC